jgi:hypothetical protein
MRPGPGPDHGAEERTSLRRKVDVAGLADVRANRSDLRCVEVIGGREQGGSEIGILARDGERVSPSSSTVARHFDPHPTFNAWRGSRRSPSGESNEIVLTNPLQNEEHG